MLLYDPVKETRVLTCLKGHTFMMMGTAGELPKPPEKPTQFLEDMTDAQVAEAVRMNDDGRVRYTRFVGDSFIHCIA